MTTNSTENFDWYFGKKASIFFTVVMLFVLGIGIRLYDLSDLPLDFAPTRQLFSALKARGMYYSMLPDAATNEHAQIAIRQWQATQVIEPPIIEQLTAYTYLVLGENLAIARLYSIFFWIIAGLPVLLLSRKIAGWTGAIFALGFYFFLPYAAIASRVFQPDPLMVSLILFGVWSTYSWIETKSWKWAIAAGLFNGLALLVKNVSVFPIFFSIFALLFVDGIKFHVKNLKTWAVAGLSVLPTGIYTLYGVFAAGFLGQQFAFRFFPGLWLDPAFYLRWKNMVEVVTGFTPFFVALLGVLIVTGPAKKLLMGLWIGYVLYGLTFAYHISSHDYYQLFLIPIVAISLAPVVEMFAANITKNSTNIVPKMFLGVFLTALLVIQLWNIRVELARNEYRSDVGYWSAIGEKLGNPGTVLTISQDYGYRLAYWGWQDVESWLDDAELNLRALDGRKIDITEKFDEKVAGKKYIVVTQMSKLDDQPEIKQLILERYPVFAEGDGYVIYDVENKKE